jgi:SnoaL-like domain
LHNFAERYTAAWCSPDAASVAAFFAPTGSLTINDGTQSVGRSAITAVVQEFMTAFPDLKVTMDDVSGDEYRGIYRWTLDGHNAGTGAHVHIRGYEEWRFGADGLIAASLGRFDAADYQRQLNAV